MRCLIAQNCTGGLAMVDGIHVYGYQLDMRRLFVKYLHHFVLVVYDRTVRFGKFGKDCTSGVYHDIVRIEPFHGVSDTCFPSAVTHYINGREALGF